MSRLTVLLCAPANPMSTSAYYTKAFRQVARVVTLGPAVGPPLLSRWQQEEYQHHFKGGDHGAADKFGLLERLVDPCDIPVPWGSLNARSLTLDVQPDLTVWIDTGDKFAVYNPDAWGAPSVCLLGDTHVSPDWRKKLADYFTHVYLQFTPLHHPLFPGSRWLPPAADPDIHLAFPHVQKAYDVVFVGQTGPAHKRRVEMLRALMRARLDVRVDSRLLEEMALLHARGRIVFNCSAALDCNMRIMEALCGGNFLLTDRVEKLDELGTEGTHLEAYGDEQELLDKARYYLDHPEDRERIARAGRQEVLAKHTYGHRVQQILAECLERPPNAPQSTNAPHTCLDAPLPAHAPGGE